MKDYSQQELEDSRPDVSARQAIEYCLGQLYKDKKHGIEDGVVSHLTFEELIGALLLGHDLLTELEVKQREIDELEEFEEELDNCIRTRFAKVLGG